MKALKVAAIVAIAMLMVMLLLLGYLFLSAEVTVSVVGAETISAEVTPQFAEHKDALTGDTFIGTVYQKFGIIENPTSGEEDFSYGVKIKTAPDEKVRSVTKGEAVECGYSDKYGNYILIKHSEKIYSFYSQLGEILINAGDKVNSGQIISTTKVNDEDGLNMLYFEIRDGDSTLDPEAFIDFSDGNLK